MVIPLCFVLYFVFRVFTNYSVVILQMLSLSHCDDNKCLTRRRAVPLRSVTSKFGRTGDSELTEWGTGERWEEEGLPSLLNQTCSGNSAHHQRRQLVKNKLICHLISNNSASICRALNPHGLLSTANVCFSS